MISVMLYSPVKQSYYEQYKDEKTPQEIYYLIKDNVEKTQLNYRDFISIIFFIWVFVNKRATLEMYLESTVAWHV